LARAVLERTAKAMLETPIGRTIQMAAHHSISFHREKIFAHFPGADHRALDHLCVQLCGGVLGLDICRPAKFPGIGRLGVPVIAPRDSRIESFNRS
jgi:hypothetical protein